MKLTNVPKVLRATLQIKGTSLATPRHPTNEARAKRKIGGGLTGIPLLEVTRCVADVKPRNSGVGGGGILREHDAVW